MSKMYYSRPMWTMVQSHLPFHFLLTYPVIHILYSGESNFKVEKLGKFETKIETILDGGSETHMGLTDGKNLKWEPHDTVPLICRTQHTVWPMSHMCLTSLQKCNQAQWQMLFRQQFHA